MIADVADMPGFDASAINRGVTAKAKGQQRQDGTWNTVRETAPDTTALDKQRSVSRGVVFWGLPPGHSPYAQPTVNCSTHGAMNCVDINPAGALWRCTMCNEGAWQPR